MIRFLDWLNAGRISPADVGISVSYDKNGDEEQQTRVEPREFDEANTRMEDEDEEVG